MRKIFTLLAIALTFTGLQAQWTYTASDFPAQGDEQYYRNADTTGFTVPAGGTGQSWDVSNLAASGTATWRFIDPATGPGNSNFPNATHCWTSTNTQYRYFEVTADTAFLVGEKSVANTPCPYSNAAAFMAFPFSFGNTISDTTEGEYPDGFVSNVTRRGRITVEFDGDGSLITPYATYSNVIRIHRHTVYDDSSWTGVVNSDLVRDEYEWYEQGRPFPVFYYQKSVLTLNGGNPQVDKIIVYADSMMTSNQAEFIFDQKVTVAPNPAENQTTVNFSLEQSEKVMITVFNLNGQKMQVVDLGQQTAGNHETSLDLSTLSTGLYVVKVEAGNLVSSRRLIVE